MHALRRFALTLILAGPTALAACRSSNAYDIANRESTDATLIVENQNFYDVDVYAVSSGLPTRIGTVSGNTTVTFTLRSTLYNTTDFRLVATPIGGNGRAASHVLALSSGQTVKFTIAPRLNQSFAQIVP
jgi:hypothetical protein